MRSSAGAILVAFPGISIDHAEPFIRAHINNLEQPIHTLHFGFLPKRIDENTTILPPINLRTQLFKSFAFRSRVFKTEDDYYYHFLKKHIRKRPIKAVLAEYGQVGANLAPLCRDLNIPLVVHFHGHDAFMKEVLSEFQHRYREMFDISSFIVGVSKDMCAQLNLLGAPPSKIVHIPCGADPDLFTARLATNRSKTIISVGRFVEKKAPHLVLYSFKRVLEEIPDARLCMVGDGPLLPICRQLAQALKIDEHVSFTGKLAHEQISEKLKTSRVFVQHSVVAENGDSEGTPVSVMEAGLYGLPVVATAHMGIKDVVEDGKTGLLVNEFDVEAMASKIVQLLTDPEMARSLGKAAQKRVMQYFSLPVTSMKLNQVMSAAINNSPIDFAGNW